MEQKLEEVKKESSEEAQEYFQFIRKSVDDGSYFKDALNWYFFRYVSPICDRTLLIFGAVLAAVVLYFLVQMVKSAFPLVEKAPIFIRAQDQSLYFPNLVTLKPREGTIGYDPTVETVDEAVLKYLLSVYVNDRESFDFSKAEIEDVNRKFNRIRNTSTPTEYRNFQLVMSKDNPNSPIQFFGQNVVKRIDVQSVKLIKKEPKDFAAKAREFLSRKIPTEAEVRFVATTVSKNTETNELKTATESYIAKVNFSFDGVDKDEKGGEPLVFTVSGYKLFIVK